MKKIYVSILAIGLTAMAGLAQENLNKEITLDKDFVPIEKKATKKSSLPQVMKPAQSETTSQLDYSNWAKPTSVTTDIPTMLPFGYRTGHIFSDQRGYFDIGAGSQLNIVGSAGYRLIDEKDLKVEAWLQHNSTWSGKNSTTQIADELLKKQKYNDNVIGFDLQNKMSAGTLGLGARVHFDNFNYYGGIDNFSDATNWWDNNKQTFLDVNIGGNWTGKVNVARYHDITYHATVKYNYGGYSKGFLYAGPATDGLFYKDIDGAKEHYFQAEVGAQYAIKASSDIGMNIRFDYLNRKNHVFVTELNALETITRSPSMLTLAPFITYRGQNLDIRLGADVAFCFNDGAKIRVAPNAQAAYELSPGMSLFINAKGGKTFNTLSRMAVLNRYSDPNGDYSNTFSPIDCDFGLKVGPFSGFTATIYGGYGIFKNDMATYCPVSVQPYAAAYYKTIDSKGFKVGAKAEYKYRSWAEISVSGTFAPQDDKFKEGDSYSGYSLGLDRAKFIANADLNVYPIKELTLNVGFEYRGGRHALLMGPTTDDGYAFSFMEMNNVTNLKAGASYRFNQMITIWAKASNLLNKQWDVLNGMGAQKLNIMGGVALVF